MGPGNKGAGEMKGETGMEHDCLSREILEKKYEELCELCHPGFLSQCDQNINIVIKKAICRFMERCSNPAIWCYGDHTKMLMADFIFELKKARYIIDHSLAGNMDGGFEIICKEEITGKGIDGIVISSWRYKDEIIDELKKNYDHIPYLDIYAELEKAGIHIEATYYEAAHPYAKYRRLNRLQRLVRQEKDMEMRRMALREIVESYIAIKDFRTAILYAKQLCALSGETWAQNMWERLSELYGLQKAALAQVDENNVVMFCIDGLRRKEVTEQYMPNLWNYLKDHTYNYRNAYALSTSTYESLIPAYSGNSDLRTEYYRLNTVPKGRCRFINEAKRQKRTVCFYTDGTGYVEDETICVTTKWQTAAERLWDFTLDAVQETNGLFYLHMLYESHYSYSNPYTEAEIIAEGTSIFFDYLEKNGGAIRTDYDRQQKDALHYLDDVIIPLLEQLPCRLVLYADHGNVLFGRDEALEDIAEIKYTFAEDLLQVPLAIRCPELGVGEDRSQISLMELNDIIISLLSREPYHHQKKSVIKALRSEIYNPDFRYLYQKTGNGRGLLAFEVFLFEEGCKLAIFSDGSIELYETQTEQKITDRSKKENFLKRIQGEITVCDISDLKLEQEMIAGV